MNTRKYLSLLGLMVCLPWAPARGSDHDDGETSIKSRNRNITDVYAFREDWQDSDGSANNLVLIMCTNPRSVPRQHYFFDDSARYEIHITRNTTTTVAATGRRDLTLRFDFDPPSETTFNQAFTLTALSVASGVETTIGSATGTTTAAPQGIGTAAQPAPNAVSNSLTIGGSTISVFAGLREDPFFFDVKAYFRVRAGALNHGPVELFALTPEDADDFAEGYNVNAIVVRVPIAFLQTTALEPVFDVWTTISVPN
jgi:hypothetical protein